MKYLKFYLILAFISIISCKTSQETTIVIAPEAPVTTKVLSSEEAKEIQGGMWIPSLLEGMNEEEMQLLGSNLTAKDIYDVNNSSLKDAIAIFGGGCTSEVISPNGLLLTNHHCGYGAIQSHSSVEHDYLKDGFWAKDYDEELPTPNLKATFIVRIDDVTSEVLAGITDDMDEAAKKKLTDQNITKATKSAVKEAWQSANIKSFYKGNQYFLIISEVYTDVRMVGAPPSSIGKFGKDTDNWMWPRHTGDFSMFRIYADANNRPAEYSKDNVPYKSKRYLPISIDGVEENDFAMIFGFPGRTDEYLPAVGIDQRVNVLNPAKIEVRENALDIMDKYMRADDAIRIQYASKFAGIANYWKFFIGENQGILQKNVIEKKKAKERAFSKIVDEKELTEYQSILSDFERLYKEIEEVALAKSYWDEVVYRNVELLNITLGAYQLEQAYKKGGEEAFEKAKQRALNSYERKYKNYSVKVDQPVFENLTALYAEKIPKEYLPEGMKGVDFTALTNDIYSSTKLTSLEGTKDLLSGTPEEVIEKLNSDKAYVFAKELHEVYYSKISPKYQQINLQLVAVQKKYMKALMEVFPEDRFYPDANFTLRVNYGRVQGFEPKDGMIYTPKTYLKGVKEKYKPGDYEFDVPQKLLDLYNTKDYGQYGENGKMPVNFLSTNHSTGGNSGSPVIDADGNLIGLLFDGTWEGVMGDLYYDADIVRSISVDIRYVLFVIDKYAGAERLIKEMKLVHPKKK
ncbi:MAG: S46 family peptidase [Flavobacteriaceae bacterium]|nr:S46 family peptidase [Flavobacteriaceae bacterium]